MEYFTLFSFVSSHLAIESKCLPKFKNLNDKVFYIVLNLMQLLNVYSLQGKSGNSVCFVLLSYSIFAFNCWLPIFKFEIELDCQKDVFSSQF
jgi:hypothetical protein